MELMLKELDMDNDDDGEARSNADEGPIHFSDCHGDFHHGSKTLVNDFGMDLSAWMVTIERFWF